MGSFLEEKLLYTITLSLHTSAALAYLGIDRQLVTAYSWYTIRYKSVHCRESRSDMLSSIGLFSVDTVGDAIRDVDDNVEAIIKQKLGLLGELHPKSVQNKSTIIHVHRPRHSVSNSRPTFLSSEAGIASS